jgi:hypothetical protein
VCNQCKSEYHSVPTQSWPSWKSCDRNRSSELSHTTDLGRNYSPCGDYITTPLYGSRIMYIQAGNRKLVLQYHVISSRLLISDLGSSKRWSFMARQKKFSGDRTNGLTTPQLGVFLVNSDQSSLETGKAKDNGPLGSPKCIP